MNDTSIGYLRVWFNHWFSTAYCLIEQLQAGCEKIHLNVDIIGSNRSDLCVYKVLCKEFYTEPTIMSDENYVKWCLDFCKEHEINVFIPRRGQSCISKHISEFNALGILVMTDDNSDLIQMLGDKKATADFFEKHNICKVPEMHIVNNVTLFEEKYKFLKEKYPDERICFKYNKDEGATSFRVIDDRVETIQSLRLGRGLKISYDDAVRMLGEVESFDDLILMPYLDGPEISIDSLMTSNGFIALTRRKEGSRATLIEYIPKFFEISKRFARISKLKMPYNLQMRQHKNEWYLLEVNTRMAGGTHKCNEVGVNFPFLAFSELLHLPFTLPVIQNVKEVLISEIETPIKIN